MSTRIVFPGYRAVHTHICHQFHRTIVLYYDFQVYIIEKIQVTPLKDRINHLVDKRLRGELSRCNNCSMACGDIPIPD